MRRKSAMFCVILSANAARRGAILRSTAWKSGGFIVELQTSETATWSKAGTPPYGPDQGRRRGLSGGTELVTAPPSIVAALFAADGPAFVTGIQHAVESNVATR